jgi:regulator of protease activity HflC (stomatin/prohibitin superfamily)
MRLPPQTLTTKDDVSVVVSAIVKYQVKDIRPFLLEIWDQVDVLADVVAGAVKSAVNSVDYIELASSAAEKAVLDAARSKVNQYGFKVHEVTFTDCGRVRSIRLIQATPIEIAN